MKNSTRIGSEVVVDIPSGFRFEVTDMDHVLLDFMRPIDGVRGDVAHLPRAQIELDSAKVTAWIVAGGRNTPGIRVFEA